MDPINYSLNVKDPFDNAMQGLQTGLALHDRADQKQQQLLLQQQMHTDIGSVINNPEATGKDYADLVLKHPQLADAAKQSWATYSDAQKQNSLNNISQVYAALNSNQPEIAKQILDEQATAATNAGKTNDAQAASRMSQMIDLDPNTAKQSIMLHLAAIPDGQKVLESLKVPGDVQKGNADAVRATYEAQHTPERFAMEQSQSKANIANLDSQIQNRADQMNLDRDKLQSDVQLKLYELKQKNGELPEYVQKQVNESASDAISSQQSASQMLSLADKIDSANMGSGILTKGWEAIKSATGEQTDVSQIRAKYSGLVTQASMAAYKKVASGSTSDKDIETAMRGVPSDTADPAFMSSYLRGMAKLQQLDSIQNNAKTDWLSQNKFLGKSKNDMEIDGVKVPAGTSFKAFTDQYLQQKYNDIIKSQKVEKAKNLGNQQSSNIDLSSRSYMQFA